METNEIMVNEEVIETTEEIVEAGSGKGFKVAAGIGLGVVVGIVAYKCVVKPISAKIKAKREQQTVDVDCGDFECTDYSIEDESEENED